MDSEASRLTTYFFGLCTAILTLLVFLDVIEGDAVAPVMAVITAAWFFAGEVVRRKVWSQESFDAFVNAPPEGNESDSHGVEEVPVLPSDGLNTL